jgi:hypothetical protein
VQDLDRIAPPVREEEQVPHLRLTAVVAIPIKSADRARAHALTEDFDAGLDELASAHVYRSGVLPAPPAKPGVYLFADGPKVMHVGRTRNLQARRRNQTSPSGDHFVATFPFRLARSRALKIHDDLPPARGDLEVHERFAPYLLQAKADVRAMDFRFVIIEDDAKQALFEIFASIAFDSPHNSWETH